MKYIALHLLFLLAFHSASSAQTPEEIVADYRAKASRACEKLDATLQRESTAIAAKMISQGDTEGAAALSEQVKLKLKGEEVTAPKPEAEKLFKQYDTARTVALKPHREESLKKLDGLLANHAGKDMASILKIGQARMVIEGNTPLNPSQPLSPKRYLSQNRFPKVWGYYTNPNYDVKYGTLTLREDGTFFLQAAAAVAGKWRPTANPDILEFDIELKDGKLEQTTMNLLNKEAATMKRVSGDRFLKPL